MVLKNKKDRLRVPPGLIAGIFVFIFLGVALYLRIALPYDRIFTDEWIKFVGSDSYYHMRIVDNLVFNFPHLSSIDPYMLYPGGMKIDTLPFYSYLLAGIIRLMSFGSPNAHIIDVIGVYFPAVMGSLTVIPVYFIGKAIFNRWAGVFAAGLIAILPGEFLGRTVLGFADHHSIEVLFTTIVMLFLIMALKKSAQHKLDFSAFKQKQWAAIAAPMIYSILAGIFLGLFFGTWLGAPLFALIIFLFFCIQFIVDHIREKNTEYLVIVGATTFIIAFLVFLPFFNTVTYLAILLIPLFAIVIMGALSWLFRTRTIKPIYYPVSLGLCAIIGIGLFYLIDVSLFNAFLKMLGRINPTGVSLTTLEAQPILFPGGTFSFSVAWANFTTGLFMSFISLGVIAGSLWKNNRADKMVLLVWSIVILIATLMMRRFAYYYAVNVALLTGYAAWLLLDFAGFKERDRNIQAEPEQISRKKKKQKRRQVTSNGTGRWNLRITGLVIVVFLVFYPNIGPLPKIGPFPAGTRPAIDTAKAIPFIPADAWCETCDWIRDNTPEPFGDTNYYYKYYAAKDGYKPPESAYSIAVWWDYGYWITRMGHRIPTCNPGSGARPGTAKLFATQTVKAANDTANKLNSKYIITDYDAATVKFYAIASYAGLDESEFFEMYFQDQGNGMVRGDYYFYPEYYSSLLVRLYNFNGQEYIPDTITVISFEDRVSDGEPYKFITNSQTFSDYAAADAFIKSRSSENYRIVGTDPFMSPVPLNKLEEYRQVFSSEGTKTYSGGLMPQVKVFEYTGIP